MGKGGDKAVPSGEKKEVLIDGRLYDVSDMKHPGGTVIDFYAGKGIDASQAFMNFHVRSKKAKKYLDSLPSRPADQKVVKANLLPGQSELLADFEQLTRDLEAEGFFKPNITHIIYRLAEVLALYLVGGYLALNGQIIIGLVLMAISQGRCGWLMHEGGHYSLTGESLLQLYFMLFFNSYLGNINIDKRIQEVVYGLGCGMSGGWWRSQHNKHHSMPQKLGHDVDLNTLPLVAFTEKVAKRIGLPMKVWIRLQAFTFPAITTLLVALGWQLYLHPRHIARKRLGVEAAMLALRYILWHAFFTTKYGLLQSAVMYLAFVWMGANYIFINFAVSHTHLDVVPKDDTQVCAFTID